MLENTHGLPGRTYKKKKNFKNPNQKIHFVFISKADNLVTQSVNKLSHLQTAFSVELGTAACMHRASQVK